MTRRRRSAMLEVVSIAARTSVVLAWLGCALLGSAAHADRRKPASVVARVVGLELYDDGAVVTIAAGSQQGIARTARARFREGDTKKPLAGGEAMIIRVDRRTTVLKTHVPPAQIRANRYIQLDP